MSSNTAYDISDDLPSVDELSAVQAKLAEKRKKQEKEKQAEEQRERAGDGVTDEKGRLEDPNTKAKEEEERKLKAKEAAARKKKEEARRREEEEKRKREQLIEQDRWVTPKFKVRESRTIAIEKIFFLMKADGSFTGNKQEFFDEALAHLQEKYSHYATK